MFPESSRRRVTTGSRWEPVVGYSRAVKIGPLVAVAGTTAMGPDGELVGVGDAYAQTRRILEIIRLALGEVGAEMGHVIRTRIYVTDMALWEEVGRAHGEVFGDIRPASTMVEVTALALPEMLVEIDADAVIPTPEGES